MFAQALYDTTYTTTQVSTGGGMALGTLLFIYLAVWVVSIIAFWKVFEKAGQPGWAAIIPIYNIYVLLKVAGRPGWWLLLFLIPFVNLIVSIIVSLDVAKNFGKDAVFAIFGLIIFSFIGYLILGFGDAKYVGPSAGGGSATPTAEPAA